MVTDGGSRHTGPIRLPSPPHRALLMAGMSAKPAGPAGSLPSPLELAWPAGLGTCLWGALGPPTPQA